MEYIDIFNHLGSIRSSKLNEFTKSINKGDLCCIIGNNAHRVNTIFYLLVKAISQNNKIGYVVTNKATSKKKLFLLVSNISQLGQLNSFEEIENELKRLKTQSENPVVFVNDFFSIQPGLTNNDKPCENKFKEVSIWLKQLAVRYNVPIVTCLIFDSETKIKEFLFPFNGRSLQDYRKECFDRIYSTYKSEYYSTAGKQNLFNQFKKAHYKLAQLKPTMFVTSYVGVGDAVWYDPAIPFVNIMRPFIIDRRLIPTEFNGYNVNFMQLGGPPEGFAPDMALSQEDKYAPGNYINYVDNNLPLLAKELLIPELTRNEALDALTGGFQNHINDCVKTRFKKIEEEKDNIIFFTKLQYRLKQAYALSDAYKKYKDKNWGFSLTATLFSKNMPLILNFNNGVDNEFVKNGNTYGEQQSYPFSHFYGIYPELSFLKKMLHPFSQFYPPFRKYPHGQLIPATLSSICFFRTDKQSQISRKDIKLCRPILEDLIEYLNPPIIITYCKKAHNYFLAQKLLDIESIKTPLGKRMISASRGSIFINNSKIKYINLPHPINYKPYNQKEIAKAWEFCFSEE